MPTPGRLASDFAFAPLFALALVTACGFRTDPASGGLICVDSSDGTETGEPDPGSCENPIAMEVIDGQTAHGFVSGCSETEGFCEASGGEQVFKLRHHPQLHPGGHGDQSRDAGRGGSEW
jgi:hypothetical protein